MGKRREGRQAAIQYLFAHDLHGEVSEMERNAFWELHSANNKVREHAESLIKGIQQNQQNIDEQITKRLENYSFERVGTVDRNILRVAVYELLFVNEIPVRVIINEAVEIARDLGDTQTRIFVNGILDKIAKAVRPPGSAEATRSAPVNQEQDQDMDD